MSSWGPTPEQIAGRYNMQAETRNKTVWDLFLQWRHLNSGFTRRRLHLDRLSAFLATRLFMTLVGVLIVCNGVFVGIVSNSVMERTLDEYHRLPWCWPL